MRRPDHLVTGAVVGLVVVAVVAVATNARHAEVIAAAALASAWGWVTVVCFLKGKPWTGALGLLAAPAALAGFVVAVVFWFLFALVVGLMLVLPALVGAGSRAQPGSWWERRLSPPAVAAAGPTRAAFVAWLAPIVAVALAGAVLAVEDYRGERRAPRGPSQVVLSGQDHSGQDLTDRDLTGAAVVAADLSGSDLRGVRAAGADLHDSDLSGILARRANFERANLDGADLHGADLGSANLRVARLAEANLAGASLVGADLRGADLRQAALDGADLTAARLGGARLTGVAYDERTTWPEGYPPPRAGTTAVQTSSTSAAGSNRPATSKKAIAG